ncbi:MAG: peptidylprolyl isomerase [Longicatena sp.]
MIELLKKQWFVVLVTLILIGFLVYVVVDSNKGKIPGKSIDGKEVVATIKNDGSVSADDLFKDLYNRAGKNALTLQFQVAVFDQGVKTTKEIKESASNFEKNFLSNAESQMAQSGAKNIKEYVNSQISSFGYSYETLDKYSIIVAKMQKIQTDYIDKHFDDLFNPVYESVKPRVVSHILINVKDINKPTDDEAKKIKEVEDALANGDSFESVAKKYSDDTTSAANNGYIGYIDTNTTQYVESFKAASLKLKEGEVSDWVKETNTNYSGWHKIYAKEVEKATLEKDKDVKPYLHQAIMNAKPSLSYMYTWETAKNLDIKYASDEVEKQIKATFDVKE